MEPAWRRAERAPKVEVEPEVKEEFKPRELANTVWAFAAVNRPDEKMFTALAIAAEQLLSSLKPKSHEHTFFFLTQVCDRYMCLSQACNQCR